jgi:hypothetical protein
MYFMVLLLGDHRGLLAGLVRGRDGPARPESADDVPPRAPPEPAALLAGGAAKPAACRGPKPVVLDRGRELVGNVHGTLFSSSVATAVVMAFHLDAFHPDDEWHLAGSTPVAVLFPGY